MIDQIQKARKHIEIAVTQAGQINNVPAFLMVSILEGVLSEMRAIAQSEIMDFYEEKLKEEQKQEEKGEEDHGTKSEHREPKEED